MRIYTEVNFKWDGNKYTEVSSQSEEYNGPVDKMVARGFATDETSRNTWYDEDGVRWEIVGYDGKSNEELGYSHQGHVLYKNGEVVGWGGNHRLGKKYGGTKFTSCESKGTMKSKVFGQYDPENKWMDKTGYDKFIDDKEAKEETERLKRELKQETAVVARRMEETGEAQTQLAAIEAGKIQSENVAALERSLLASGTTPEEAQQMTAKGQEASAQVTQKLHAAKDVSLQQALTGIAQMDVAGVKTAEDLGMGLKTLSQDLSKHKTSLANVLKQQKLANIGAMEAAGSGQKGAMGYGADIATAWLSSPKGQAWMATMLAKITGGSDIALKQDINLVNTSPKGINIYEFEYKDKAYGDGRYRGVMAQEVPWASFRNTDGYLWVDYSKVDVDFERVA